MVLTLMLVLEFRFKLRLLKANGNRVCLLDKDAGNSEVFLS